MSEEGKDPPQLKLLLVEDDDDHAYIVERSLIGSSLATQFHRVHDGEQALNYIRQCGEFTHATAPDLVLLDLKLPGMTGFELLEEIRKESRFCALPVVVFSTSGASHDIRLAYQLGANSYLKKPMEYDDFKQMIGVLCEYWGRWNQRPHSFFSNE